VASSSLTSVRARVSRFRFPVLAIAAAAIAATVIPTGIGAATPASPAAHPTLRQVEAQISVLNNRAERITESFDSANTQLAALQRKEQITDAQLSKDRAFLAKVQQRVAASAAAAYRTGGLDPTLSLVSSGSPQTFLEQTASLDEVARYDANQVAYANAAQRSVAAAQAVHNAEVAQQQATLKSIASEKSQIRDLLDQQNQLLDRLKASQRAALATQQTATVQHQVALRTS
jgi:peptidoglycan hydrolase CwlO-like protein